MADQKTWNTDPKYWANLADREAEKLGLPKGLMSSIVLYGERSIKNQYNKTTGARTPFQIIPEMRNRVLKQTGIDAYLNDDNAAAAAAYIMKDNYKRNNGDVEQAIGEYHGGISRKQWGPINKDYRKRVLNALGVKSKQSDTSNLTDRSLAYTPPQNIKTPFQAAQEQFEVEQGPAIAKVYSAYASGQMAPEDEKSFEADVRAGHIMLPQGGTLKGKPSKNAGAVVLPQAITEAYISGKMSSSDKAQLEEDMRAGHVKLPPSQAALTPPSGEIPGVAPAGWTAPTEQTILPAAPKPRGILQQVGDTAAYDLGAVAAGGQTALGIIGGIAGHVGGTVEGFGQQLLSGEFGTPQAAQAIADVATQRGEQGAQFGMSMIPSTTQSQEVLQNIGRAAEPLASLPLVMGGGIGAQAGILGKAAVPVVETAARSGIATATPIVQQAAQSVKQGAQAAAQPFVRAGESIQAGAQRARDGVRDAMGMGAQSADNASSAANVGAAQVDQATVRSALAQDLPYPPSLTEGQITRDPAQLKFEVETAKNPDLGAPLRQRHEEQHMVMQQNVDAFIDMTDGQATNMREAGISVDKALQSKLKADKNRVRAAYAKADKSEEATTPIDLTTPVKVGDNEPVSIIDYLNSQPDLPTTPILSSAKKIAVALGVANKSDDGMLIPANPTIKQMEKWRSEINASTNLEAPNIRQTAILKGLIDAHVAPAEGVLYKAARIERTKVARHWENRKIMTDLTGLKVGTDDRRIALEDIQKRIIHDSSLDDMRVAKRALLTAGDEGKQAWKDIQAQTLREIKDQSTAGVAPDARGNQMISPAKLNQAINRLDDAGKLEFIFGKQGAEKLRAVNDISKTLFTVPVSAAINHSNTAAALATMIDLSLTVTSGMPAPVANALRIATRHIKDKNVRARVHKALNPNQNNNQ